ncbi:MAG: DUF3299 domain-containing protein [Rubrivivax sp.]|nr:MAG: DUF3299 domain-containing protein [Rubrivivax sp.]
MKPPAQPGSCPHWVGLVVAAGVALSGGHRVAAAPIQAAQTHSPAAAPAARSAKTSASPQGGKPAVPPRHLKWQELVPKDWDPGQQVRDRMKGQNVDALSDTDPRVMEMMREMRAVWDAAPTNPAMDGVTGRLPGYVVPLDDSSQGLKEFLLVPYYGACIHSPPPPANQIVHVVSPRTVKDFQSMDTVWVSGTIRIQRGDSYMGVSAYRIDATKIERYVRRPAQNDAD